jgi:predicted acetyltransferase
VSIDIRPAASLEELRDALNVISHYFAVDNSIEAAGRFAGWTEIDRVHGAWEDGRVVGGAGVIPLELSVPGGSRVRAAGVTIIGVLPSHRRRGLLRQMMRVQLDDCHARREPVAYLWASEATIYPRFGYGLASRIGEMTLAKERTAFAAPFTPRGVFRLLELEEAAETFPGVYEQLLPQRPGMFARGDEWWRTRRLYDDPERRRGGPLTRTLLELDGQPVGYAMYRVAQDWRAGSSTGTVTIVEAVAPSPEATRELWRWLLDFDWTSRFSMNLMPLDHELFLLLAEPRRMEFRVSDGLWVRLVDLQAALTGRGYAGDGEVVLDVADDFCGWNAGRWRVSAAGVEPTDADADLALDVTGLGSVYLGGFTFADLHRASRLDELRAGAVTRADTLFATGVQPWCAEIF